MKKLSIFSILTLLCLFYPKYAYGQQANKFGIHILEPSDVTKASQLVNSSGGDWGWVTVVIRDDDLDFDKWQDFMDQCREKHLIPIVRIATRLEGSFWVIPKLEDMEKWSSFLNSLNWPVANMYVVIFNEPNHAKEWGNKINPRGYAKILSAFADKFHSLNFKFLILNAGLDLAAPNGKETMESYRFMQEMNREIPKIFEKLDGWTSHSYPNHGFLGKPWEIGKTSIQGYLWELNTLKNYFGVKKELPVFITETGWPKNNSKLKIQNSKLNLKTKNYYDEETIANYIKYAFENVWLKDSRVMAVTPFVLNYPADLFYDFSWLKVSGEPFSQYKEVQLIPKTTQWPKQETKFEIIDITLPPFMPAETEYKGKITLRNTGQSIWGENTKLITNPTVSEELIVSPLILSNNVFVKPKDFIQTEFSITSKQEQGLFDFSWENSKDFRIKVLPKSFLAKAEFGFWKLLYLKIKNIF